MHHIDNLDLTEYNSYRLKAICAQAFFPDTEEEIQQIYRDRKGTKKILLGSGHNVILSKEYYEEDFLIFSGNFDSISIDGNNIIAEAGATMLELSTLALENSLIGLEIFYDIPSSLGGAVVMNAGASGEEIKDVLVKVRYYDIAKDVFGEMTNEGIGFSYRNSCFQNDPDMIITKIWLELKSGDKYLIKNKMEQIKAARWAKQPRDYPNAGSVFKRPNGVFVGPMIEKLGLKGYRIGGAMVSEKHAGFIVNLDNAKGLDIVKLISCLRESIKNNFGIDLNIEQRVI
jgi:UDP-N-acetylmuramate dehydrogenase